MFDLKKIGIAVLGDNDVCCIEFRLNGVDYQESAYADNWISAATAAFSRALDLELVCCYFSCRTDDGQLFNCSVQLKCGDEEFSYTVNGMPFKEAIGSAIGLAAAAVFESRRHNDMCHS